MGASQRRWKGWLAWRACSTIRVTLPALPERLRPFGRGWGPPCLHGISRSISASSPRLASGSPEPAFAAAWAAGQALSLAQVITLALGMNNAAAMNQSGTPAATVAAPSTATPDTSTVRRFGLTAREVDVLRLTTLGLTYAQIAERLSNQPAHRRRPSAGNLWQARRYVAYRRYPDSPGAEARLTCDHHRATISGSLPREFLVDLVRVLP